MQASERVQFDQFLAARRAAPGTNGVITPEDREALFREFVKWNQARERR